MGRPTLVPTEEQRKLAKKLAATGHSHKQIGEYMEISPKTVRKHFDKELTRAVIEINSHVAWKLAQTCLAGNVPAMIYWTKARMGWSENRPQEQGPASIPDFVVNVQKKTLQENTTQENSVPEKIAA